MKNTQIHIAIIAAAIFAAHGSNAAAEDASLPTTAEAPATPDSAPVSSSAVNTPGDAKSIPAAKAPAGASAPGEAIIIPAPPSGMSQVVFFRPSAMGMAISCNIRENGKMLGTTNNGRYFVLTTTPGAHKFTTKSEATDELTIEAEADEISYVKCKIGMGIMVGRPNISPSTKEEFDSRSAKLKPSDPEKMARTIAEDDAKLASVH